MENLTSKLFIYLAFIGLISCTYSKNNSTSEVTKSKKEILQTTLWKLNKVTVDNVEKPITDSDGTIQVFNNQNSVLIFDKKGNLKNSFSYEIEEQDNDIKTITINNKTGEPQKFITMVFDGWLQLNIVDGVKVLKYDFNKLTDSLAIKKIRASATL